MSEETTVKEVAPQRTTVIYDKMEKKNRRPTRQEVLKLSTLWYLFSEMFFIVKEGLLKRE